ncbi:MAG: fibronectin type III domain-containing protein [Acutalibacteraceae bacterium]
MKKIISITLSILLLLGTFSIAVLADNSEAINVYVTISDKDGKLALAQEKISVTDIDDDNLLTLNDALYCAHEAKYPGGAAAGYNSAESDWGLSLYKLWGAENGGSYGYYVNNKSANGLTDEVKENDYVNAFVYTDLSTWLDTYCYFDVNTVSAKAGEAINLTLSTAGYDDNWEQIAIPEEGATITVDGVETKFKTDSNGKVTITVANGGKHIISAKSDSKILVPPVCIAEIEASATQSTSATVNTANTTVSTTTTTTAKTTSATVAKLTVKTPKIKLFAGKKKISVKYTKVNGATGFQVKYKTSKGKWKTKNFNTKKSTTKVIKGLKKGKYQVKVRAFAKQNNKTTYSSWTKIKTVKVFNAYKI